MPTTWYLGPAGSLVALPAPGRDITRPLSRPSGEQVSLAGGITVDRSGRGRRRHTLTWSYLTQDEAAIVERLWQLPGELILDDPSRRNRLTANQSTGSDTGRVSDGCIARFQGTVSSSTAQARSGLRSFAWATGSSLTTTDRGFFLYESATVVDDTWHPVRAGVWYCASAYLRASAAVTMAPGINWADATGALITAPGGAGVALPTANWNTRLQFTGQAPAGAAYGIPKFLNATTTGSAITVYLDDPQMEEVDGSSSTASAHVIGSGVPRVATAGELGQTTPLATWEQVELALVEL